MVETRSLQVSWKCSFIPLHPDVKQIASGTSATIFQCAGKQKAKLGEDAIRQLPTSSRATMENTIKQVSAKQGTFVIFLSHVNLLELCAAVSGIGCSGQCQSFLCWRAVWRWNLQQRFQIERQQMELEFQGSGCETEGCNRAYLPVWWIGAAAGSCIQRDDLHSIDECTQRLQSSLSLLGKTTYSTVRQCCAGGDCWVQDCPAGGRNTSLWWQCPVTQRMLLLDGIFFILTSLTPQSHILCKEAHNIISNGPSLPLKDRH